MSTVAVIIICLNFFIWFSIWLSNKHALHQQTKHIQRLEEERDSVTARAQAEEAALRVQNSELRDENTRLAVELRTLIEYGKGVASGYEDRYKSGNGERSGMEGCQKGGVRKFGWDDGDVGYTAYVPYE